MKKKIFALLLAGLVAVSATACGAGNSSKPASDAAASGAASSTGSEAAVSSAVSSTPEAASGAAEPEAPAKNYLLYAGGWAGSKGTATGLMAYNYDVENQKLSYIGNFGGHKSMSCLVTDGDLLFACMETKVEGEDLLFSYRVKENGELEEISSVHTNGMAICMLSIDTANKNIFAVNFESCNVAMIKYDDAGALELLDSYQFTDPGSFETGYGPTDRQDGPYPHCARVMPDGNHLCVCSMGSDKIYIFTIDRENGKLVPCPELTVTIDGGEGARQIIFSADGKFAYMNTEMGCTVYVYGVGDDGSLTQLQKLSTLDPELENPEKGWCSVSVLSADGKFLYTGNRGQNNIVGFAVGADGLLTNIGFFDCGGDSPRGLSFGYNDEVMFVSNNKSGTLDIMEFNKETGEIGECLKHIPNVPGSANVVWGEY